MRVGRLQPNTLSTILKSLEPNLEMTADKDLPILPGKVSRLQKQYIPTTGDSPLYRLISVMATANSEVTQELPSQQEIVNNHRDFFRQVPRRVMSVPMFITEALDMHLPRMVQSMGNLFQIGASEVNLDRSTNPEPPIEMRSPSNVSIPAMNDSTRAESLGCPGERQSSTVPVLVSSIDLAFVSCGSASRSLPENQHWTKDYAHLDLDWSMQASKSYL